MIKGLSKEMKRILLDIYNEVFEKGYLFTDWKMNQTKFTDKGKQKR